MKHLLIFAVALFSVLSINAADKKYPVSEIPDSLTKGAHAVIRLSKTTFKVNSLRSTELVKQFAITILDRDGDRFSNFIADYDQLHKVKNIEGVLYDADGNVVKRLKQKDLVDVSTVDNISLIDDSRVKAHNFYYNVYPYTIEYYYETTFSHSFFYPSWMPVADEDISLQSATFDLIYPSNLGMRFREMNIDKKPAKTETGGTVEMKWAMENKKAIKVPSLFATWKDLIPAVYLAPNSFEMANLRGDMKNWKNYGLFQYELIKGRDVLPDNIKSKVHELTANSKSEKEKIKVLYDYLQKNTRYISIQLGVGGWQPFDAKYVSANGYGDCKALTNYMHSLLKEAGITSYYTLVYAGDNTFAQNRVMEDFPSTQFNHVILCVPTGKDSMWLECTSQELPAGYMSGFTANRKALMIKEDGGYLVSTPRYGLNQNVQTRVVHASINPDGEADLNIQSAYYGMQQDRYSAIVKALSAEKVKEYLSRSMSLATYEINNYKYDLNTADVPVLHETLNIKASNYATMMGKRIFIIPNMINQSSLQMVMDENRTADFLFGTAYCDSDYVEIKVPAGYKLEGSIKDVELSGPIGKYSVKSSFDGDKIIYKRYMERYSGRIPVSKQKEVVDFYNTIYKTDKSRIVLVKEAD